jgi:receptor-type tyrosine-protein phosphatase R
VVKHYWINSWPDHGVPHSTSFVLNLLHEVAEDKAANLDAPVVVHCSAGCGVSDVFLQVLRPQHEQDERV